MAWNEPGGSGNKDPWGGGKNDQGPPDLDEVFKKLQSKIGSIFGGGGSGGDRSGASFGGGSGSLGVGLVLIVLLVVWAASGLYIIDEGKRGVIRQFGEYTSTTLPGPHWYPRFVQSVEIVDVQKIRDATIGYRSASGRQTKSNVERESLMLTKDENIVDIQMAVQYKVKSASDYLFNVLDPEDTLKQATESAIREVIGKNTMDFVITTGRAEIAAKARELIQSILDKYGTGLEITSVNMQEAQPPQQVKAAFDDAVKAREDNETSKNEAQAYANDIIPRAHGNAARQREEASAYREQVVSEAKGEADRFVKVLTEYKKAPEVTRKRLYIDAMESVMTNSTKVMVDVSGGNNLLYLPLDKLMERQSSDFVPMPRNIEPEVLRAPADSRSRSNLRSRGDGQ